MQSLSLSFKTDTFIQKKNFCPRRIRIRLDIRIIPFIIIFVKYYFQMKA